MYTVCVCRKDLYLLCVCAVEVDEKEARAVGRT